MPFQVLNLCTLRLIQSVTLVHELEMKIKVAAPEDGVIDASQVRLALSWLGEEPSDKA